MLIGVSGFAAMVTIFGCKSDTVHDNALIRAEIEKVLRIQEDAYDLNNEEGRQRFAATCIDSLLSVGGDNGGIGHTADFYVHDFADGYKKRPSNREFRILENTVLVTSVYQSFKVFDQDSIFFNARSTKVFVKQGRAWKMAFATYAPLPVIYRQPRSIGSAVLKDYAGLYESGQAVPDTIIVADGKLVLASSGRSELLPIDDSTFFGNGYFGTTGFLRNSGRAVTHSYFEFPDGQRLLFRKLD